jgi:hypothetical protein
MIRTILTHDTANGVARIRYEHHDVVVEETYSLIAVIPSTAYVLAAMNIEFDETYQTKAIEYLEASILRGIEDGIIQNPPPVIEPEIPADEPDETEAAE